jgi:tetratricopeptide (TPR) repeat protein
MTAPTFRETLDTGIRLMREGSPTEACAHFEHAVSLAGDATERAETLSHLGRARGTLGNLAIVLLLMGDYQRTIDAFGELITLGESFNDLFGVSIGASNLGECYIDLGALDHAEAMCRRALDLAQQINAPPLKPDPLRNLARIQLERSDFDGALDLARQALALTDEYQRENLRRQALVTLEQSLLDAQASFYTILILRYHAALAQVVDHPAIAQVHRRIAVELTEQLADSLTDKTLQQTFRNSSLVRLVANG